MVKKFVLMTVLLLLSVILISCGQNPGVKKPLKVSEKLKIEVNHDVKEDMAIISKVTSEPAGLKGALDGAALDVFTKQIKAAAAKGRVKIRKYDDINIKILEASKEVARGELSFIDESYYVDKANPSKTLTLAQGKQRTYTIHLKKVDGKWKIAVVYPKK